MDASFTFTVNGQQRTVATDPARSLLDVLREDLQLTGAKYGCGEGQCGACTILLNGKPTRACSTPVSAADRQTVETIEGLAAGDKLHPVQEAFLAEGAPQCGYCAPGMIMAAVALLREHARPTEAQIAERMEEHLCRCCGYPRITRAIQRAAAQLVGKTP